MQEAQYTCALEVHQLAVVFWRRSRFLKSSVSIYSTRRSDAPRAKKLLKLESRTVPSVNTGMMFKKKKIHSVIFYTSAGIRLKK